MSNDESRRIGEEPEAGTCLIYDGTCEVGEVPTPAEGTLRKLLGRTIGGKD